MKTALTLIALLVCLASFAEPRALASVPAPASEALIYLLDIRTGRFLPEAGSIRPNRVYALKKDSRADAFFHLSSEQGNFAEPPEQLVEGTVLSGEKLGESPKKRFELKSNGTWVPTSHNESILVSQGGASPQLRLRFPRVRAKPKN